MSGTSNWHSLSIRAILLMAFAVVTALVLNQLSPVGIPLVGQWDLQKGSVHATPNEELFNERLEISDIEVAKMIYDGAKTLFVDARPKEDFEDGHVKGAVSLSLRNFDAHIEVFINQYPPEQPIVTYCSGRTCEDSHHLAQLLIDLGYEHVNIMIDGFQQWKKRGFPVD